MNSTSLRLAYARFLAAAEAVGKAGAATTVPPGEWDVEQQLAHIVAVDASMLAAVYSVAAGAHPTFDNRLALEPWNLARISDLAGDQARLRQRIRVQGDALCSAAEQLSEDELAQSIPTLLMSGGALQLDQPVALHDLISGLADDHLPRHTEQILGLLSPDESLAVG